PDPVIFRRAAKALDQSRGARILVVGDSLATDIRGAIAAGYDSLFVSRGIHTEELGIAPGAEPDPKRLAEVCARHGQRPTMAIPTLRWQAGRRSYTLSRLAPAAEARWFFALLVETLG